MNKPRLYAIHRQQGLHYSIEIKEDGDTYLVTSPDFPELTTFGEDIASAVKYAYAALDEAIHARIANKKEIPIPIDKNGLKIVVSNNTYKAIWAYIS